MTQHLTQTTVSVTTVLPTFSHKKAMQSENKHS